MKISIITPSYNQGDFIEAAIKSVLKQNYSDFEHIIVDAESTDNTAEILKKYHHLKVISEPDEGQSDALNKGFKICTGDVVGWLNTDETYEDGIFQHIKANFDLKKFDVLYGDYISVDNDIETLVSSIPFSPNMLCWRQYMTTLTLFLSRKIFEDRNYINISYEASMDKEFLIRLEQKGYKFKYLNEIFGRFVWHINNKSTLIRDVQKKESRNIIQKYFFRNKMTAKIFFWPSKLYYDLKFHFLKFLMTK